MARLWYTVAGALLAVCTAAQSTAGSICKWQEPRAGVVRDSLYIEGGLYGLYKDGVCTTTQRHYGSLFKLNFSTPFDSKSNLTGLFTPLNETIDSSAVTYVNGFMVADNDEWYTFGGQAFPIADNYTQNTGVTRYAVYQPNPTASGAQLGPSPNYPIVKGNLTNRYVTNGAGVSIPSESLGFYFGGLRTSTSSNISQYPSSNLKDAPTTLVSNMIKVDTSIYSEPSWSEIPLPSNVASRAEAMLAWVPTGPKGILIAIGGVPNPADVAPNWGCYMNSTAVAINQDRGTSYMSNVSIYDVASGQWYVQPTKNAPTAQLAQACVVVASDNKVHNIYLYGGYNGVDASEASDDVWVLSVPSFTWIKAAAGTSGHGRYSHVCAKPYPDQMLIVGGTTKCQNKLDTTAIVDVFNLNTLKWTGSYDPKQWSNYTMPSVVSSAIQATPTASMDDGLRALFQTSYPSQLPRWYPYTPTSNDNVNPPPSRPGWVIPVAASLAGAAIVGIIIATICCCRRRNKKTSDRNSRNSIFSWMFGHSHEKDSNSDESVTQVSHSPAPGVHEAIGDSFYKPRPRSNVAELNSDSDLNSPHMHSPITTIPRHPQSPRSVELQGEPTRYELPGDYHTPISTPNIRNHPLYPYSVDGRTASGHTQAISSPTTDAMSPYELAHKHSDEAILPAPPNDLLLGETVNATARPPPRPLSRVIQPRQQSPPGAVSPDLSAASHSPVITPSTPPLQPILGHRPSHTRNASSLSSDLPNLSSPSPREDNRRSVAISALPDSPSSSSNADNRPNIGRRIEKEIRRKELRHWPRTEQGKSAYAENEDLYGSGRGDTV